MPSCLIPVIWSPRPDIQNTLVFNPATSLPWKLSRTLSKTDISNNNWLVMLLNWGCVSNKTSDKCEKQKCVFASSSWWNATYLSKIVIDIRNPFIVHYSQYVISVAELLHEVIIECVIVLAFKISWWRSSEFGLNTATCMCRCGLFFMKEN